MHRFLNSCRTIPRSKKYSDIIFKCFSCELSAIKVVLAKPPRNQTCNFCPRRKFCTQIEEPPEEYVSEEDIKLISGGDSELEHKLRVIILEADVMRQDGKCVPSTNYMNQNHWRELLALKTRTARSKYLSYLFKTQKKVENKTARKEEQRLIRESRPKMVFPDDGKMRYYLGGNNMFLRIYDSSMNNMYNNKLMKAMQFGQKLIIDCGFHGNMNRKENINTAKQLTLLFSDNRYHIDPFDLHLCNLQKDNDLHDALYKFMPTMYDPEFPLNIYENSYLDVFPKNKLVYLTPHCRQEMTEFDHDALYIIGGIVDKVNNEPLSLAKAKEEGIRMAKFPLDRYLSWGAGAGKSLTLNQVISILLDVKHTGDWQHALRHVPKRKLFQQSNDDQLQPRERFSNLNDDLPVSRQLIYADRLKSRGDVSSYREERTERYKPGLPRSGWRPNTNNYDEDKPSRRGGIDVKSILDSDR